MIDKSAGVAKAPKLDNLDVELVRESLVALVNEMRANMIYASYSSVIYEGHDFSCCLMLADGRQAAMGQDDHPLHMFAVPTSTKAVLDQFAGDIHPGDVFLHNEPYTGGTHLNDILMLYPIFGDGKLRFFTAIRAHWNDVGGMTPGSLSGQVTEIYQEGVCIPPVKIYEKGRLNAPLLEIMISNMRLRHERIGDFECMLGASRKAEKRLDALFARFGGDGLQEATETLMARSEAVMRRRLSELPDGVYHAETYLESNGHTPEPLRIALKLTIAGDRLVADFAGTSPQTAGPTNVGPSMAQNAVFTIAKSFLDPDVPINHGAFAPIEVLAPVGSFINARSPAPCGGMAEVKFTIDSVVAIALAKAIPARRVGDLKGTANHVHISGKRNDERFILYEWPAGGTGASHGVDGSNAVRTFTEGDFNSIQSVEVIEASLPVRIERCEIRQDSCGDGTFRGGFGLRRDVRLLCDEAVLSVISDRNVIPPYSVNNGAPPACNRFGVLRGSDVLEPSAIPGKVSGFNLKLGDIVREETAGGGGYGDPLDRDPAAVGRDVAEAYLSTEAARSRYGVVLSDGAVDVVATDALRTEMRQARITMKLVAAEGGRPAGPRRDVDLPAATFDALDVAEGELVELVPTDGAPIRAWARRVTDLAVGAVRVSRDSFDLIDLREGDAVRLRAIAGGALSARMGS